MEQTKIKCVHSSSTTYALLIYRRWKKIFCHLSDFFEHYFMHHLYFQNEFDKIYGILEAAGCDVNAINYLKRWK